MKTIHALWRRRLLAVALAVVVIAAVTVAVAAPPAAADPVVCTATGDCGPGPIDEGPWFCYWAVPRVFDGIEVVWVFYDHDASGPPPDQSAFIYCESGF